MSNLKRPIQIEEFTLLIRDLSDQELTNIQRQINNSIEKLNSSNELMDNLLKELLEKRKSSSEEDVYEENNSEELENDIKLYQESLNENYIVLKNQFERLTALKTELSNRGIEGSETPTSSSQNGISRPPTTTATKIKESIISQDNDGEGIYL